MTIRKDVGTRPSLPDFTPVPRKCKRHDGWTPARQKGFIEALADTGSVKHAAHAVNMTPEGAYYLRRQPGAEEFAAAWLAALDRGIERLEDIAMERAIHGVEVPVYSYGKIIGTRIVHNDRLLMFMLRNRAADRFAAGAPGKRINPPGREPAGPQRGSEEMRALILQRIADTRERLRVSREHAEALRRERETRWHWLAQRKKEAEDEDAGEDWPERDGGGDDGGADTDG